MARQKITLSGDENADWIKLADPKATEEDRAAGEQAISEAHRAKLKRTNRLKEIEGNA